MSLFRPISSEDRKICISSQDLRKIFRRSCSPTKLGKLTWDAFQAQVTEAFEAYKSRQRTLHEMVHDHRRWNMVWLGAYPDLVRKTSADFWEVEFTRIDNLDHALPWEDRLRPPI